MESTLNYLHRMLQTATDHEEPTAGHDEHGHISSEALVVFWLFSGLLLGGIIREVKKKTGIPYTPLLFVVGIGLGCAYHYLGVYGESVRAVSNVDPHGILLIFLPVLIFESGFNTEWHLFKKQFVQIIILAVPCVTLSALFLAICLKAIIGYDDIFSWSSAFMFGAILSCTDTVAVIALLKEIGASKKFNSLIEGESLLNDAVCMVLLSVSSNIAKGGTASPIGVVREFAELSLGGVVLGVLFGVVSAYWIRKIFNDEVLVVNITFFSCYLLYFMAENFDFGIKISGIIALVAFGLFMSAFGKARISTESDHAVHTFWTYVVYCAETIIFLLAGIIIGNKVFLNEEPELDLTVDIGDYIKVFYLYICMLIVRFLVIAIFMPILKNRGYGLNWKEVFVLAYGGLRGAIGIAFSLIVARDKDFSANLRQIVVFDMTGAAILTLVINGTTTGWLVKRLGLANTSQIKQRVMISFMEHFLDEMNDYQQELKGDSYLQSADWNVVSEMVGRKAFQDLINQAKDTLKNLQNEKKKNSFTRIREIFVQTALKKNKLTKDESSNSLAIELLDRNVKKSGNSELDEVNESDEALIIEARDRYIMTLKGVYYQLFEVNQCNPDTYILLVESSNWDLDNDAYPMNSWDYISTYFFNDYYMKTLNYLKFVPVVGNFAKGAIFKQLSFVYDVVSTYLIAHEKVEAMVSSFPIPEEIMLIMLKESEENRKMAEDYLTNYLSVSFPEITKSIQNLKAAYSILTRQKQLVEETHARGQIDEKEFTMLKKRIDALVMKLNEFSPEWKQPPLKQFLKTLPFFSFFSDDELNALLLCSKEIDVHKDDWMMKEGQKASKLFVITRGVGTESCKGISNNYKEKKAIGAVISMHHVINNSMRYQTGFIADSMVAGVAFDLSLIKEKLKLDKKFEEFVWRESFFFLTRYHHEELKVFAKFDRAKVNAIVQEMKFVKVKKNSTIDISQGAIFLRGQAIEYRSEDTGITSEPRTFKNIAVLLPEKGLTSFLIKAEKTCALFVLLDTQDFYDKMQSLSELVEAKKSVFVPGHKESVMMKGSSFHVNTLAGKSGHHFDRSASSRREALSATWKPKPTSSMGSNEPTPGTNPFKGAATPKAGYLAHEKNFETKEMKVLPVGTEKSPFEIERSHPSESGTPGLKKISISQTQIKEEEDEGDQHVEIPVKGDEQTNKENN